MTTILIINMLQAMQKEVHHRSQQKDINQINWLRLDNAIKNILEQEFKQCNAKNAKQQ